MKTEVGQGFGRSSRRISLIRFDSDGEIRSQPSKWSSSRLCGLRGRWGVDRGCNKTFRSLFDEVEAHQILSWVLDGGVLTNVRDKVDFQATIIL